MEHNPYRSPGEVRDVSPITIDPALAKKMVWGPAVALSVVAVLGMIVDVAVIANAFWSDGPAMIATYGPKQGRVMFIADVVVNVLVLCTHLVILLGATNLYKLDSYSGALAAAILAIIPFCSPGVIIGIPFGIWAIVVLCRAVVRNAFHKVGR